MFSVMLSRPTRTARIGLVLTALALLAACSTGTNAPQVASLGSATTTTPTGTASGNADQAAKQALQFAACMRSHGVPNFPDPQISGGQITNKISASSGINPNSPAFQNAAKACQQYRPVHSAVNGGHVDPTKVAAWAACIRQHGVPDFPDPTVDGGALRLNLSGTGIDPDSGTFQNALKSCKTINPAAGLEIQANRGGPTTGGGS